MKQRGCRIVFKRIIKFWGLSKHQTFHESTSPHQESIYVARAFLIFGILWVGLTDRILHFVIRDQQLVDRLQTIKGWLFVVLTALLIYQLVRKKADERVSYVEQLRQAYDSLADAHAELEELNASLEETQGHLIREKYHAEHLLEMAPVLIATWHRDGRLHTLNSYGQKLFGYSIEELRNLKWTELVPVMTLKHESYHTMKYIQDHVRTHELSNMDLHLCDRQRSPVDVLMNTSKLTNELGEISYMTVGVDMTEQNKMIKSIDRMTYVDFLTSIGNRRLLEQEAKERIEEEIPFTLVFFDVEGFKAINDHYGHSVGDHLLQQVAMCLTDFAGEHDVAARIGGDEFGMLLYDQGSRVVGEKRIQALKETLSSTFDLDGEERTLGYRFGVTGYPTDGSSAIVLFKNADLAMNEAKKRQEETCIIYSESLFTQEAKRLRILNEIDKAIREDHFSIVLQPIYNLRTGMAAGAEILVRWTHEEMGVISPAEFIPIAEETALILEIDRWVIDKALEAIEPLQRKYGPAFTLSLNLSAHTLISKEVVPMVSGLLEKHRVPAESVILEITETAVIADVDRAVSQVEKLRNLGLCIALDDFGTGYSSLSYLKMLPIDHVKLDKSYVGKISVTLMDEKIISSLVALSQDIGYQVVAEGIEKREQLDFLVDLGCDFGQGYHLAMPMTLERLMEQDNRSIL